MPTETPTVDAMTPAPTLAPVDDTPTVVDNTCIICPDGTTIGDFAPYADIGDSRTCSDIIEEAKLYEIGSDDCGLFEMDEFLCCYTKPENLCIICPDGVTASDGYVPGFEGTAFTCSDLIEYAKNFKSGSNACRLEDINVVYCCPT
jgi:hypothetical protein